MDSSNPLLQYAPPCLFSVPPDETYWQQIDVVCSLKRALMTGRLCPNRVKRQSVEETESLQLTHLTLSAG